MYKDHETPRFWLTYKEALQKYLEKRVRDKSVINDILHEVYVKIFVYCKRYDFCCKKAGVKNLRSWIFQVCHNTMIDRLKENSKYTFPEDIATDESLVFSTEPCQNIFTAEELIRKLPSKYAEPIYQETVLNMKQADIAMKLGLGLSATKSRIQRGKKMLKELYLQEAK